MIPALLSIWSILISSARISGNIGVTTTQQMIKEEREVSEFNIYSYIADRFRETFCMLVY